MNIPEKEFCNIMKQLGIIEGVILAEKVGDASSDAVLCATELIGDILWKARDWDDSQQVRQ